MKRVDILKLIHQNMRKSGRQTLALRIVAGLVLKKRERLQKNIIIIQNAVLRELRMIQLVYAGWNVRIFLRRRRPVFEQGDPAQDIPRRIFQAQGVQYILNDGKRVRLVDHGEACLAPVFG